VSPLVAGVDSSTQTCKVTVRELATGARVREGRASHPAETIVDPEAWWDALLRAVQRAGGLEDVVAISVSGQQHTPVFLGITGEVVHVSPLWNDVGSHQQMIDLNDELGREVWIERTGLPITLSDTVTKVRWLRDTCPHAAERTAAVALVHDWLTWRLMGHGIAGGSGDLEALVTDRSEASGTAYWSGATDDYCVDLFEHAFGRSANLPRVLGPLDRAGVTGAGIPGVPEGVPLGVGSGDNAAAALALSLADGDVVFSLGTSGVMYARARHPVHDYAGYVCSYADATGDHLPLVATLNAARNFELGAGLLGCTLGELSDLALTAPVGAEGLTLLPFFGGERTPDLPHAGASVLHASSSNFTRANFARAVIEGTLAHQVTMLGALRECAIDVDRLLLIGGATRNPAILHVLPQLVDVPLALPEYDEYVAKGAAMQAAAAWCGAFPDWPAEVSEIAPAQRANSVQEQYVSAMAELGYGELHAHPGGISSRSPRPRAE
jgi:xylulokinase